MEKIDIVYLWVDGSDKIWLEKKNKELEKAGKLTVNASHDGRFRDNNELIYSLRSIEKFAPWVNNIFIVTDNQIPSWLNTEHPKIHIVDHSDIVPAKFLPCFNSIALELYLDNIPNLSEKFIFLNDDFFFGSPVEPDYFFTKDDLSYFTLKKSSRVREYKLKDFQKKFLDKDKNLCKLSLIHAPTPFRKSFIKDIKSLFVNEIEQASNYSFRAEKVFMHRFFFNLYDLYLKRAKVRFQPRYPVNKIAILKRLLGIKIFHIQTCSNHKKNKQIIKYIEKYKPYTFCLNDGPGLKENDHILFEEFLKQYFPEKSSFEK